MDNTLSDKVFISHEKFAFCLHTHANKKNTQLLFDQPNKIIKLPGKLREKEEMVKIHKSVSLVQSRDACR